MPACPTPHSALGWAFLHLPEHPTLVPAPEGPEAGMTEDAGQEAGFSGSSSDLSALHGKRGH